MFIIRPLAHVGADFRQDGLHQGIADAVHCDHINAGDTEDMGACVDRRGVLAV